MTEYWYCENCTEEVDPSCVTYQELHDRCGHPVDRITKSQNRKQSGLKSLIFSEEVPINTIKCTGMQY